MKLLKIHSVFVSCLLIIHSQALSCRSKYGPKDEELRRIFNNCQKQQDEHSNNNRYTSEQDRMDRSYNHESNYERNSRNENSDANNRDRDSMIDEYRNDRSNSRSGIDQYNDNKRMNNDRNNENRRNNRMSNTNGMEDRNRDRNEMNRNYNSHLNSQDEFLQSEEYGNQNYYSSPRPVGRYKREKKNQMNSGQRSQYNPHSQKSNEHKENHSNEANSSDSSNVECVLHCFLENLQMTGDNGMPDRYLITHALTKDERNEDLRDFLQESIEECFQILDNENTEDNCEFSKKLWICLSEKGRANCDDWSKKTGFMF